MTKIGAAISSVSKNPSSNDGLTPLHTAAENGDLEISEMILKNIHDIKGVLVEWNGKTPLVLASDNEHIICMLLINSHMQSLILKNLGYYQESVPLYFFITDVLMQKKEKIMVSR